MAVRRQCELCRIVRALQPYRRTQRTAMRDHLRFGITEANVHRESVK
jgi:hypothetical protein